MDDQLVVAVLRQMKDVVEPEQERGGHPVNKSGWVRRVLKAVEAAGYKITQPTQSDVMAGVVV